MYSLYNELNYQLYLCTFNQNRKFIHTCVYARTVYVYVCIDKYIFFTKIALELLFWTCPVEEFRNMNFPEIQFTFHDGRTWIEKKKRKEKKNTTKTCRLLWLANF